MITESDFNFKWSPSNTGEALVWVIDEDALYSNLIPNHLVHMFTESNRVDDVSDEYPDWDGITVRFFLNDIKIDDFQTSEYFGSILLSNPQVLDLSKYPYGRYVNGANAKFVNDSFIINDRNMEDLSPWY